MIDDIEIQLALDEKQDEILSGMPVPQDGKIGDIRTNIAHKGKFFQMMKVGIDSWRYSAPYTRVPSIHTMDDYLLKSGGKMLNGSLIDAYNLTVRNATRLYGNVGMAKGKYIATDEIRARGSDGLKLYDDGGNGIFVKDGGDVGIGGVPSNKLHINSVATPNASQFRVSSSNTGGFYIFDYGDDNVFLGFDVDWDGAFKARDTSIAAIYKVSDKLYIRGSTGNTVNNVAAMTDRIVLDLATGNVGINTATPAAGFHNVGTTRLGDQATHYMAVGATGDTCWVGGGGLVFGSCYGDHLATDGLWAQVAAVNTWYNISHVDMTDGILHGVTHDGSGELTVTEPGMYKVHWTLTYQCNAANKHIETGIEISNSGSADVKGTTHTETKFANQEEFLAGTTILDLADNATLEVAIRTTDAGNPTITVDSVSITCLQVGGT